MAIALMLAVAACQAPPWALRVSSDADGGDPDGDSSGPSLSADGRYVAFSSRADDLVPGDEDGRADIFVRDVSDGTIVEVSVGPDGQDANADSWAPAISDDGSTVVFTSHATNLVPGGTDVTPTTSPIPGPTFAHDLATGTNSEVYDLGGPELAVSADGGVVAIAAQGTSGRGVVVVDRVGGTTTVVRVPSHTQYSGLSLSDDGGRVAFVEAGTAVVHDLDTGVETVALPDVEGSGPPVNCSDTSFDGSGDLLAVACLPPGALFGAFDLGTVYVRDLVDGSITIASLDADGDRLDRAFHPAFSADGRMVAFTALLPDPDGSGTWEGVVVRDLLDDTTAVIRPLDGAASTYGSEGPAISAHGEVVAFSTSDPGYTHDTDGGSAYDVVLRAPFVPRVDDLTPAEVAAGSAATLTLTGDHLANVGAVRVSGEGVVVGPVTVLDDDHVSATVTIDEGATPGARTVWAEWSSPGPTTAAPP